jgi:formamidopyrimidine-DNA glycosylase
MPEGPEIFYLKEMLKTKIKNKKFTEIISNTNSEINLPKESKILDCDCKGKLLWIETEDYYVHMHLMISGWLVFEKPKICKYEFVFDNMTIYMDDVRRFSKVYIVNSKKEHEKIIAELGLNFFSNEINEDIFIDIISNSTKNISSLLLEQSIFSGIGNYIRNEVLYLSKIHPNKKSKDIDLEDIKSLYENTRFVMFSNLYELLKTDNLKIPKEIKNISPETLEVPYKYRVYDKEKDRLGNKVTKEKMAGRWTYYVKSIQKE